MSIRFKNKNRKIVVAKGQTRQQTILELKEYIKKTQKELDKRQWIYDEYKKLLEKMANYRSWLEELENVWTDERWNS